MTTTYKKKIAKEYIKGNEEEKPIYTSYFETENLILEQIRIANDAGGANLANEVGYLVYDKKSNAKESTEIISELKLEDAVYKPIVDDLLTKNAIYLPTGIKEYGSVDNLINKIKEFLYSYFEVSSFFENFLPYLCLFYWVYEKFPFVPYVHFVGRTSTGKTTAMEVFGSICYKAIDASGSITIASIFRVTTAWKGTLLLDEFENIGEDSKAMLSFLKSGVSNKVILRTEGEKERQVRAFLAKCPKIFTSERPQTDAGLQSRTLVVPMNPNTRKIPLYRLNEFEEAAQELRNMLLLWRLRNLGKIDLTKIKYGFEELQTFDRRVQQVITPAYYLSNDMAKKNILQFAQEQQEETFRQRQDSFSGLIFITIMDIWKFKPDPSLVEITDQINIALETVKYGKRITEKKIANQVRKILSLKIDQVGHENVRIVPKTANKEKTKELCLYYGIPYPSHDSHSSHSSQKEEPINPDELPF